MKRVFILHGWRGNPHEPWFVWIKKELEKRKFKVIIPKMPHPATPTIHDWVPFLKNKVGKVNKNTYFIGHSVGCQTVLRYLKTLKNNEKIGGCVFVAPWMHLDEKTIEEEGEESVKIARPWTKSSINFNKVKRHANKFIAIFSDNDPFVPLDNINIFKNKLKAKIIVEHNKGHFDPSSNVTKVESALKSILQISNKQIYK